MTQKSVTLALCLTLMLSMPLAVANDDLTITAEDSTGVGDAESQVIQEESVDVEPPPAGAEANAVENPSAYGGTKNLVESQAPEMQPDDLPGAGIEAQAPDEAGVIEPGLSPDDEATAVPAIQNTEEVPATDFGELAVVTVSLQPVPVEAGLFEKKYQAYQVILQNTGPNPVQLLEAEMLNGLDGDEAYEQSKKGLIGPTSFLGVTGFVTTAIRRKWRNNKARDEAGEYDRQLPPATLPVNQVLTFKTLVPKSETPKAVVTYQDTVTGETYQVTYPGEPGMIPVNLTTPPLARPIETQVNPQTTEPSADEAPVEVVEPGGGEEPAVLNQHP